LLELDPTQNDRAIAKTIGVSHHTVASVRDDCEGRGQIAHVEKRNDVPCDMDKWRETYAKHRAEWLERQVEIDRRNAEYSAKGMCAHTEQMGDFRFDELANQ
jgi:hypothetical protein